MALDRKYLIYFLKKVYKALEETSGSLQHKRTLAKYDHTDYTSFELAKKALQSHSSFLLTNAFEKVSEEYNLDINAETVLYKNILSCLHRTL